VVYFTAKFHSHTSTSSVEVVLKLKPTETIRTVAILSFCKNWRTNNKVAHLSEFYYHTSFEDLMVGVIVASEVRASAMIYCWLWEVNKYDVGMRMKIRENQSTGTYFGKVARVCVCARAHTHTHTHTKDHCYFMARFVFFWRRKVIYKDCIHGNWSKDFSYV